MTLKAKLLSLLAILAIGPLLAIGVIGYAQSVSAVRAQLEGQTRLLAEDAADVIRERADIVESDLLLLAGNEETRRLLDEAAGLAHADARPDSGAAVAARSDPRAAAAAAAARAYFDRAWALFQPFYAAIELLDAEGTRVIELGDVETAALAHEADTEHDGSRLIAVTVPAQASHAASGGTVRAFVRVDALLEGDALPGRFGRQGLSLVIERSNGRLLYVGDTEKPWARNLHELGYDALAPLLTSDARVLSETDDRRLVGWTASVRAPQLDIVSLAEVAEFEAPFRAQRRTLFLLVLALAVAVMPVGAILLKRATGSLDDLTHAADLVGKGDFAPALPPPGKDEVGRLTAAFEAMVQEVRRMMSELERSRQLAAVGTFAAELSHEIRNPLTAVKLNLQRLERLVSTSDVSDRAQRPIEIALGEIARLDRVVRSALRMGRPDPPLEVRPVDARDVTARALAIVAPQLERGNVELHPSLASAPVMGDAEQLAGALVNLLLNALEAMPGGGSLEVETEAVREQGHSWADVTVRDTGGGVPEAARERLFNPFFTTRSEGTGLGLALALRTAEAHGGTITLVRSSDAGSEFCLRLPLLEA